MSVPAIQNPHPSAPVSVQSSQEAPNATAQKIATIVVESGVTTPRSTLADVGNLSADDPCFRMDDEDPFEFDSGEIADSSSTQNDLVTELESDLPLYEEYLAREELANLWGLNLEETTLPLREGRIVTVPLNDGLFCWQGLRMLGASLPSFLDEEPLAPAFAAKLLDAADHSVLGSQGPTDAALIGRLHQQKAVIVMGGTENHNIVLMITENRFFICNRGAGATHAIESYEIDLSNITEEILHNLRKHYPTTAAFRSYIDSLGWPRAPDDKVLKTQESPNCVWAGLKTAFCALFIQELGPDKGYALYKKFSAYCRLKGLDLYLKTSAHPDPTLLSALAYKYSEKVHKKKANYHEGMMKPLVQVLERLGPSQFLPL